MRPQLLQRASRHPEDADQVVDKADERNRYGLDRRSVISHEAALCAQLVTRSESVAMM
jgi:hypothetical protein